MKRLLEWFKDLKKYKKEEIDPNKEAEKNLKIAARYIFNNNPSADITIKKILFNTKYEDDMQNTTDIPDELVSSFYEKADRGDNSFIRHYFFRILRQRSDRVVRSLKHRLKRNTR